MSTSPGVTTSPLMLTVLVASGWIDRFSDRHDLAAGDRDVPNRADVVARIDEMPALEKQVVLRRTRVGTGQSETPNASTHPTTLDFGLFDSRLVESPRLAVHFALRYSPMSRSPDISCLMTLSR